MEQPLNVLSNEVLRAALYIRVSTAEQAMHGYSLEAQKELLEAYAKQNKMRIVGVYADEGKSASKQLHKRTELLRMVDDAEAGDIDVILFKDMSRWSRNASHYYTIQDRIDKANVYWIAVQQPYLETKTPTGRYQVTLMLGAAQFESDQTSERIKFVNASNIQKGGVPFGAHNCPIGYTVGEINGMKRVVKDTAKSDITMAIFDHFETHHSIRGLMIFLSDEYGIQLYDKSVRKLLKNTLYKGEYRGVTDYCEPYLSAERFDNIQRILKGRARYTAAAGRIYLFSSLLKCAECGNNLHAYHTTSHGINYLYYRCRHYTIFKNCEHKRGTREDTLEQWLLENIEPKMRKWVQEVKINATPPPDTEKKRKAIERKAKNLRELYIEGDIEKAEYTRRKEEYETQLAAIPVWKQRDTTEIETFLNSDWRTLYDNLEPSEKRVFWRSIIESITIDNAQNFTPNFFE